ncbi:MAG: DUF3152 domain-containing protein [Demequinaceae bacterium]|nr:DUF3152 domain-containing protein [Demequinaceae bacterium]
MALGSPRAIPLQGRKLPDRRGMVIIVVGAFVVGIIAGGMTTLVSRWVAHPDPGPSSSADATPVPTSGPIIPVDLYPPITRELDTDDFVAGLSGLDIVALGEGTLAVVPGVSQPEGEGPTHWIRVEVEDGLPLTLDALGVYVLTVLNDERGWGAHGRMTFARTDGAAEIRIIFASPVTASSLCPRPHEAAVVDTGPVEPVFDPNPTPEPSASPSPTGSAFPELAPSCAEEGMVVIDAYRWAAGLESFGEDRINARVYLLNHFLGHVLGVPDTTCSTEGERASVMVDHEFDIDPCLPGSWPNPVTF